MMGHDTHPRLDCTSNFRAVSGTAYLFSTKRRNLYAVPHSHLDKARARLKRKEKGLTAPLACGFDNLLAPIAEGRQEGNHSEIVQGRLTQRSDRFAIDGIAHRNNHGIPRKDSEIVRRSASSCQCREDHLTAIVHRRQSEERLARSADHLSANRLPCLRHKMVLGKQAKILRAGGSNQSLESQLRVPTRHCQDEISNVRTVNGLGYFHQDVVLGKNGREGRRRASNEKTLARISIHQLEPGERLAIELSD